MSDDREMSTGRQPTQAEIEHTTSEVLPPMSAPARVPAVLPARRTPRRWLRGALLFLLLAAVAAGYWWSHAGNGVPAGLAMGNGRLEVDEVDIDTKFAGRIAQLMVDEGDLVKPGQIVAVMDTRDLEASLKKSQALVEQAKKVLDEAESNLAQAQTQVKFTQQELDRTATLVPNGYATVEQLDQRTQQHNAAVALEAAAAERVAQAQHALDAATHDVELYQVNIADNSLLAPKEGPIEYRVANVGEVLPAGGKVFTMLDASYVYMDIYLPTDQAGRVRIGSEARIVVDAYPGHPIPAKVVFIASQAQFTPKTVETSDERDKLMFRIRVRIDPDRLEGRAAMVRSGLPGVAYVRTDPEAVWPANLQPGPPPSLTPPTPR
jgi:HlyD family secretion protein